MLRDPQNFAAVGSISFFHQLTGEEWRKLPAGFSSPDNKWQWLSPLFLSLSPSMMLELICYMDAVMSLQCHSRIYYSNNRVTVVLETVLTWFYFSTTSINQPCEYVCSSDNETPLHGKVLPLSVILICISGSQKQTSK